MDPTRERIDGIRRRRSEAENHVIDEFFAGRIDRREFIRRSTVLGMTASLAAFLAACGGDDGGGASPTATGPTGEVRPGGTLRSGFIAPAGELDPLTVADEGGLAVLGQTGEYLAWSNENLELEPRIAESWEPNDDASVWTFRIRQGVTFHDGSPLTAEDVAESINRLADPKNKSNALSAFVGSLSAGGASATDDATVVFELDAPRGAFPYLLSSDNYNAIILPATFDGRWDRTFIGTGPWVLDSHRPEVGVTYVKNESYWDPARVPLVDRSEVTFYAEDQAKVLALQSGQIDVLSQFSPVSGQALLADPSVVVLELQAAQHRQVHMRTDQDPFRDKRTRQAMALLLNRPEIIQGLLDGKADIGNDSPFAPIYPFTDTSVAQREQDVEQARQLLADAGQAEGFEVTLSTWDNYEIPDLAVVIQNAAKEIGITVKLNVTDAGTYYSDFWLDSPLGITDYGHRGVPDVFLTAPLTSDGVWNAAHFQNATYDDLVQDYLSAQDLESQRAAARSIQELLLDETPIIFPYFYFHLTGTRNTVAGVEATGMGHLDLTKAGFTE